MAKISIKDLSKITPSLKRAIDETHKRIAILVSEMVLEEVRRRIPDEGGWYAIYKNALKVVAEKDKIKVVGDARIAITTLPANNTAIFIEGTSDQAVVLQAYNPWPVDMIPAIEGGLMANARAVPSSESETMALRVRLFPLISGIKDSLLELGAKTINNGVPQINGKSYVDMDFLSLRLEHGLGPFSRHPHWIPAINKAANFINKAVKESSDGFNKSVKEGLR